MSHEKDIQPGENDITRASSPQPHGEIEDMKKNYGQLDAAAEYLRLHENEFADVTPEEERKVLRKIDLLLMPIMLVTITLAAVDVRSGPKPTLVSPTSGSAPLPTNKA